MKKISFLLFLVGCLFAVIGAKAATEVTIPTTAGSYINWNNADLTKCKTENSGANVGSTGSQTVITFNIKNTVAQDYVMSFFTGASKCTAELGVTLKDDTETYLDKTVSVKDISTWSLLSPHAFIIKSLPVGNYTLTFKVNSNTGSYAGNYGKLAFYPLSSYDQAPTPGSITIANGYYNGPRVGGDNTSVGYVSNNGSATYLFNNNSEGAYNLGIEIQRLNSGGTMNVSIADAVTGDVKVSQDYTIASDASGSYTATTIPLSGSVGTGFNALTLSFSDGSSYICNYQNICLSYVGTLAEVTGVSIDGQTVTEGTTTDWLCQLPISYTDATTTLSVATSNGTVALSAVDEDGSAVTVTTNADGTFTLPTPNANKTTTITIALTATDGATAAKETYTLQLFHIGSISITGITVGGVDESSSLLEALNGDDHAATLSDKIFTAVPTVVATLVDGSTVTAEGTLSGIKATYNIKGVIGTLEQDYTLTIDGIHTYTASENDETVDLKYTGAGKTADGVWTNGLYTITTTGIDGWNNSSFKFNDADNTLSLPADVKVKQVIFKNFSSNYNSNGEGLTSLTSDGATAYIPSKHGYSNTSDAVYDLVVNIDNHTAGTPITFTINGGGQPTAWLELTTEKVAITSAPVVKSQSVTVSNNHAVVALSFDREMTETTATIGNQTVTAEGGSSTLYFSVWNLSWNSNNNLVISTNAAKDTYGNSNASEISVAVNIGAQPAVEKAAYDYVVSTAEKFTSALAAVKESNKTSDAARKVIFVKNGTYDFGSTGQSLDAYNVSIIGESEDGVIIKGNRDGITNAVFNTGSKTGVYVQDITFYNENNYNTASKRGVAVALSGGNKAVFKRVRMLSTQDTQVTGSRAYYENCDIHGTVDFICGGGNHFYYHTNLALEAPGSVITAPSTSSQEKWGYVFQHCTISNASDTVKSADGQYSLGRPWQNEPRTYYLNTTMNIKPSDAGWGKMGNLPTHFYEYNSMDSDGNVIDLSKRQNSPSSTNTYTPVLTDDEAAKFTLENVLGGTDSWLPTEQTVTSGKANVTISGTTLSWDAVDDARTYVIFLNGEYLDNTAETGYTVTDEGTYTVRTANLMGGLGETSNELAYGKVATITIKEGFKRTSFSSTQAIDFSKTTGITAYIVTSTDNGTATATAVTSVPANTGVIIQGNAGTYDLYAGTESSTLSGNLLVAATSDYTVKDGEKVYGYGKKNDSEGFYLYAEGRTVSAGKAYLKITSGAAAKEFILFSDETTGIEAINNFFPSSKAGTETFGSQFIIHNSEEPQYNLSGQHVDNGYKGIVIVNGRKVIRK